MSRLILLLEERSMKELLDHLLPRLFPDLSFLCVPHEGKQDLEKSLPRKLRAWREPGLRFLVLRDNDQGDCSRIKARLQEICAGTGRTDVTTIRLACQELEAWYLGDPEALAMAFDRPELRSIPKKARFRDPDAVVNPAAELKKLAPEFQKISGARLMAEAMDAERNTSRSFQVLMESLRRHQGSGAERDRH